MDDEVHPSVWKKERINRCSIFSLKINAENSARWHHRVSPAIPFDSRSSRSESNSGWHFFEPVYFSVIEQAGKELCMCFDAFGRVWSTSQVMAWCHDCFPSRTLGTYIPFGTCMRCVPGDKENKGPRSPTITCSISHWDSSYLSFRRSEPFLICGRH